jgi:DNA gyrase/topoisomerase IV subunit A
MILSNAPAAYNKTMSLVGSCMSDGYHHGDTSLQKAINKLAKPFGCSEQLLLGDGFFGTPITPDASAGRYTSVKINPEIKEIITESSFLNTKTTDEQYNPFFVNIPVGLLTMTVGIAVGYKTTILPRKRSDIIAFLAGKNRTKLIPHFKGFNGVVKPYENTGKSWLISGVYDVDEKKKKITITDIPPLMKFSKFYSKLLNWVDDSGMKIVIKNNSTNSPNVTLTYRGRKKDEFQKLIDVVNKRTKMLVTETLVFVKGSTVVVYERIQDYLEDYKFRVEEIKLERYKYFLAKHIKGKTYAEAKLEFITYMMAKKRSRADVKEFLGSYEKWISIKLDTIKASYINKDSISDTRKEIRDQEKKIIEFDKLVKSQDLVVKDQLENKVFRGIKTESVALFDEEFSDEINGIEVFDGESNTEDEMLDE